MPAISDYRMKISTTTNRKKEFGPEPVKPRGIGGSGGWLPCSSWPHYMRLAEIILTGANRHPFCGGARRNKIQDLQTAENPNPAIDISGRPARI